MCGLPVFVCEGKNVCYLLFSLFCLLQNCLFHLAFFCFRSPPIIVSAIVRSKPTDEAGTGPSCQGGWVVSCEVINLAAVDNIHIQVCMGDGSIVVLLNHIRCQMCCVVLCFVLFCFVFIFLTRDIHDGLIPAVFVHFLFLSVFPASLRRLSISLLV